MRQDEFRELKQLERCVEKISGDVDAAVVEGFSDRYFLDKLGFEGKIFMSAERTLEDLVEDVSRGAEKVVVLTDFDEHGKEENRKISHSLDQEIDVIRAARDEFGSQLTSTGRRAVEDVRPLFDDKDQKFVEAALDGLFFR
jgi:5S rRNA maturation endonuclease (ribonuclease M5)